APLAVSFVSMFRSSSLLFGFLARFLPCFTDEDTPFFLFCLHLFHTPEVLWNVAFGAIDGINTNVQWAFKIHCLQHFCSAQINISKFCPPQASTTSGSVNYCWGDLLGSRRWRAKAG